MPSTDKLRKYLEQFSPLPQADWEAFQSRLKWRVFNRKQPILAKGEVENYVAYIEYQAEALVDTGLWCISYADLQATYTATGTGDKIGRLAAEQLYIRKNRRQLSLLKDSAEQRYLTLLKDNAHFLQLVPLKYLAAYIGITPQALSRIRRQLMGDQTIY